MDSTLESREYRSPIAMDVALRTTINQREKIAEMEQVCLAVLAKLQPANNIEFCYNAEHRRYSTVHRGAQRPLPDYIAPPSARLAVVVTDGRAVCGRGSRVEGARRPMTTAVTHDECLMRRSVRRLLSIASVMRWLPLIPT